MKLPIQSQRKLSRELQRAPLVAVASSISVGSSTLPSAKMTTVTTTANAQRRRSMEVGIKRLATLSTR